MKDLVKVIDTPDILEDLRVLVRKGIPIFAQDFEQFGKDIVCCLYYAVKAQLPNSNLIFLNDFYSGDTFIGFNWLVDSDDFGIGDCIPHLVATRYERGNEDNDYQTSIIIKDDRAYVTRLSRAEILARWSFMRNVLPQEEFGRYGICLVLSSA